jgi:gluconate 2-dehydrogenase gamma chain
VSTRRDVLKAAAAAVPLSFLPVSTADAERASEFAAEALEQSQKTGAPYTPKFYKADEWKELRVLVDMIIPKDTKSGSATDAGVPEFMDWLANDNPPSYQWSRDALRWIDGFAYNAFGHNFVKCTVAQRHELLDQIAWPKQTKPALADGVSFFNRLRDFTASGFYSSKMGIADIGYIGNVARPEWHGCPKPALDHLGMSY